MCFVNCDLIGWARFVHVVVVKVVIDEYRSCCREYMLVRMLLLRYVLVNCELLGWVDFMQVLVVEVWLGCKEYPIRFL